MKKERLKYGMFTEGELGFLLENLKRGKLIEEKERIEIQNVEENILTKSIGGVFYKYKNEANNKNTEQRLKILKAIKESDDFAIEFYGDYDDYGCSSCTLITYTITREPHKIYIERLKKEGRELINAEKIRLRKVSKLEARKVLTEKNKKRKVGRPKKETVANIIAEEMRRFRVPYNRFRMV